MASIYFSLPSSAGYILNQDNFVRNIIINESDLPVNYTEEDICDYINALPNQERMITDTDSKTNIVIVN